MRTECCEHCQSLWRKFTIPCAFYYLRKNKSGSGADTTNGTRYAGFFCRRAMSLGNGGKGAIGADERSCLALKDNECALSSAQGSSYD